MLLFLWIDQRTTRLFLWCLHLKFSVKRMLKVKCHFHCQNAWAWHNFCNRTDRSFDLPIGLWKKIFMYTYVVPSLFRGSVWCRLLQSQALSCLSSRKGENYFKMFIFWMEVNHHFWCIQEVRKSKYWLSFMTQQQADLCLSENVWPWREGFPSLFYYLFIERSKSSLGYYWMCSFCFCSPQKPNNS